METVAEDRLTEQEWESKYGTRGTNIGTNPHWFGLLLFVAIVARWRRKITF